MTLPVTCSQTVGPFFGIGMAPLFRDDFVPAGVPGERVTIHGRVLDGDGHGVPDAQIEIWQADTQGRYPGAESKEEGGFQGFGRVPTDDHGGFQFRTIRPGCVAGRDSTVQAPHLVVLVFMRGLLRHLVTRVYFADETANANDPILSLVPAERRDTLMAKRESGDEAMFTWNIRLQGDAETVFFEL